MKKLIYVWTILVVIGAIALAWSFPVDKRYDGVRNRLYVYSAHQIRIPSEEEVYIAGGASQHFMLRNSDGEEIEGTQQEKPLGWGKRDRYKLEPKLVQGGTWTLEEGNNIEIRVTSKNQISVVKALKPELKTIVRAVIILVMVICWALVYSLMKKNLNLFDSEVEYYEYEQD